MSTPGIERRERTPTVTRLFVAIGLAVAILTVSLPSQGKLWPVVVALIACAALLSSLQSRRARDATAGWQIALTVTFIAAVTFYVNNSSIQKYGTLGLYLFGIATFAALTGRRYFLDRNIGFIVTLTIITGAWFSNAIVQAAYEWHTAGGLTTENNECATATARFLLSAAWIVSIAVAMSYAAFATMRLPLDAPATLARGSTLWIVAGSLVIAIYFGVTHWGDWQVQTACL